MSARSGTGVKADPSDPDIEVAVLRNVPPGGIVRVERRWGVVCPGRRPGAVVIVDFWDGGREHVDSSTKIELLRRGAS